MKKSTENLLPGLALVAIVASAAVMSWGQPASTDSTATDIKITLRAVRIAEPASNILRFHVEGIELEVVLPEEMPDNPPCGDHDFSVVGPEEWPEGIPYPCECVIGPCPCKPKLPPDNSFLPRPVDLLLEDWEWKHQGLWWPDESDTYGNLFGCNCTVLTYNPGHTECYCPGAPDCEWRNDQNGYWECGR
jgi:hypothetical protein